MATRVLDPTEGTPYESVIGLEVHVQLATETKMFCGCRNRFGAEPNSQTCPVCLALPGALPVMNRRAIEWSVAAGLACGCDIATRTKFDRKNYFYPDLPKGYQISQFDQPLCSGGGFEISTEPEGDGDGKTKWIRLTRIHLEEDAGKNTHVEGQPESLVDLNRCGVPLLEFVTEPDLRTAEEASALLRQLRLTMLYAGVSDCNMEEGSLRCDVNVSIRPRGSADLETRCEIKNLNSFTNVEQAIVHEIRRQIKVKSAGGEIVQETRLFDPNRGETRGMRGKEEAHDYRYFPEPDLPPLELDPAWIEDIRSGLPELPRARLERLTSELGLALYHAEIIVRDPGLARYLDACVVLFPDAKEIGNWLVTTVQEEMNARGVDIDGLGIDPERFVELVAAVADERVSRQKSKDVFRAMLGNEKTVDGLIAELGLAQVSDDGFLRDAITEVFSEQPKALADVRAGKKNSVNFIVGQVMRKTKGKANPGKVAQLIEELAGESS